MDLSFLPYKYINVLKNTNINLLYEIRLRTGYPVKLNYNNENVYLSHNGITTNKENVMICSNSDICEIINNVTEHSLYAFNGRIKEGYLTTKGGIRIGLAGECVFNDDKIKTIKNFSSLNIRIPHMIPDCSNSFINQIILKENVNNTLLISTPFKGKTTLLKDIAIKINKILALPILIIDERGEFAEIEGENIDKISYSNKEFAFNNGLRSLSPSIIITDELSSVEDWVFVQNAVNSGVKIVASCHSDNIEDLQKKQFFIKDIFNRYVV